MSRLAKRPIIIPKGVEVKLANDVVNAKSAKGTLSLNVAKGIVIKIDGDKIFVTSDKLVANANLGLFWALVKNLVDGVSKGFEKKLELVGVGYRAALKGNHLDIQIGFSHPTLLEIPKGITVQIEKAIEILISGVDKQLVGQFAAAVRAIKKPEPYKGKGIRYKDEYVRKKAGKAAKAKV